MTEQRSAFEDKKSIIEEYIAFLKEHGYIIVKALPRNPRHTGIKTATGVWGYFRDKVLKKYPITAINVRFTKTEEVNIIKNYLMSRERAGLSKEDAASETCRLIDKLFDEEYSLRLGFPIISFDFIASKNKIISRMLEELYAETYEDNNTKWLEIADEYMEKMRKEELNGKEAK